MKTLAAEALAALGGDKLVVGGAARFVFSTTYRFWSGYGDLTLDGEIFEGIGAGALLSPIGSELGGAANGLTIELSGLDPDVAASIELEDYHQKPVTVWRLIFNAAGSVLLAPSVYMRGKVDTVTVIENQTAAIRFAIEGPRRDMSRRGSRIRSDADQRILGGATDGGLKHISAAHRKTLTWGGNPQTAGGSTNGRGSLLQIRQRAALSS